MANGMQFKNNAVSTLAGSITNVQTSFSVAAAEGALFPALGANQYFKATLIASNGDREIVKVTARDSDTMTVTRAQEGTTALAFASGSRVELRMTAEEYEKFWSSENDGSGSGLDADKLDGYQSSQAATPDTVAVRDADGDLLMRNAEVSGNANIGGVLNEALGADIASAATVDLDSATGNFVRITGTTTITAITLGAGKERTVLFTDALTLTHGASLVLPGGANITTTANTIAVFRGGAAGVVYCVACSKVSGQGGRLVDVQVFHGTSWSGVSGTWTKPANLSSGAFLIIDACGGGGQGGGAAATSSNASCGSGGGASVRVKYKIPASSVGATAAVVVGDGGYSATTGSAGASGGQTSFTSGGSSLTVAGGAGGFVLAAGTTFAMTDYNGGFISAWSCNFTGAVAMETNETQDTNNNYAARAVRLSATQAWATQGAPSPVNGRAGGQSANTTDSTGYAAEYNALGAGGGGSLNIGTKSAVAGGRGAAGYLVVYTYD